MKELSTAYNPKEIEDKWYLSWEQNKAFSANAKSTKEPFCIVIPPPNITGVLHMGHALDATLQDLLIRYERMRGKEALWVPGVDHAGIATQTVVEKDLIKKTNKRRKDFPREEFLSYIWDWKKEKEISICNQLKKLGCSCDWDRYRFTMDEKSNKAVRTCFKKMFDEGLIYRGDYLVHWDPVTQTALADDEVEHEEKDSFLYYFRYPLVDSKDFVVIATTRPETMLGDTALAVSSKDPRYTSLIGKKAIVPIVNREISIIADPFVDPEFGTGIVKITPAHDPNDYEVAHRHHLPLINIMTPDGKINENGKPFSGLSMQEGRKAIVQEMQKRNLVEKIVPYKVRVGISYRSKAVIEPYLSKQWFVKMAPFQDRLMKAVQENRVQLFPSQFKETYYHWIQNLRDWCISRQLWWGHRIPIWYAKNDPSRMICYIGDSLPDEVKNDPTSWVQDEDVLDTWFSSALWPFNVLGWPEETDDLKKFYPTSVLVTGHDILFFWIARMILMGEYILDDVPFHKTFIHGLIYGKSYWREDKDGSATYVAPEERLRFDLGEVTPKDVFFRWEKMSKSKGNIIDPLEMIAGYGTDALRLTLTASTTHARHIDLDRRRFEEYKNFVNKIWNGARFIFLHLKITEEDFATGLDRSLFTLEDFWILSRLNQVIEDVHLHIKEFLFDKLASSLYQFFWDEFCSYYLEMSKPFLFGQQGSLETQKNKQKLLVILLLDFIRLLHPISPFITEELFSLLKEAFGKASLQKGDIYTKEAIEALQAPFCMKAPYPKVLDPKDIFPEKEKEFSFLQSIIRSVRNIRTEMKVPLGQKTKLYLFGSEKEIQLIEKNLHILLSLVKIEEVIFSPPKNSKGGSTALCEGITLWIPLSLELLIKEKERLTKERDKLVQLREGNLHKLSNPEFLSKAPPHVVENIKKQVEQSSKGILEIEGKMQEISE